MKAFVSAVVAAIVIAIVGAVILDMTGMSSANVFTSADTRL